MAGVLVPYYVELFLEKGAAVRKYSMLERDTDK